MGPLGVTANTAHRDKEEHPTPSRGGGWTERSANATLIVIAVLTPKEVAVPRADPVPEARRLLAQVLGALELLDHQPVLVRRELGVRERGEARRERLEERVDARLAVPWGARALHPDPEPVRAVRDGPGRDDYDIPVRDGEKEGGVARVSAGVLNRCLVTKCLFWG